MQTSHDAEHAVIGMCLNRDAGLGIALGLGLTAASFDHEACQAIFKSMVDAEAAKRGHLLDTLSADKPQLVDTMLECSARDAGSLDIEVYVNEVLAWAWQRNVLRALSAATATAGARVPWEPTQRIRDRLMPALDALLSNDRSDQVGPVGVDDVLGEVLEATEQEIEARNSGKPTGISSGMRPFDTWTGGGFARGSLHTFAARTGVGKTTLAVNFLHAAAMGGFHCCYFSVEMPNEDIVRKLLSLDAGISATRIRSGDLDDAHLDRLIASTRRIHGKHIWFDDSTRAKVDNVELACRRLKRQGALDLIVIDYLQQFGCAGRHVSSHERIMQVSARIKQLARDLDIAVIGLAQLNRDAEKDGEPEMRHIKESGAIEQDSDLVALIHGNEDDGMRLFVAKNRHGKGRFQFPLEANLAVNSLRAATVNLEVAR